MVIEEFGSDHAFKFAIERPHARESDRRERHLKAAGSPTEPPPRRSAALDSWKSGDIERKPAPALAMFTDGRQQRVLILQNDNCRAEERDGDASAAEIHFDVIPH